MLRRIDPWLAVPAVALLALSVLMVFSTTALSSQEIYGNRFTFLIKHVLAVGLGVGFLILSSSIAPERLGRYAPWLFGLMLFLVFLVDLPGVGHHAGGASRWIGFGSFRFQPGEFLKLSVIIYMASYIGRHQDKMTAFVPGALVPLMILGFVACLLLLQPDFGTTVIIMSVVFMQLFLASQLRHIVAVGLVGVFGLVIVAMTSAYRMKRIETFLDPLSQRSAAGYQLVQSLIAVGSGGLWGNGLGGGEQKLHYLPAAHTDFIYALIAEELGLIGAVGVLILFLIIGFRGLSITRGLSGSPFHAALALGCSLLLVLPALLNMGVVLGLFPTKGLVLPLVAYGGSAMIVHLTALGILLRLSTYVSRS